MRSTAALRATFASAAALLLAGCAATAIVPAPVPGDAAAPLAQRWYAPLPHDGRVDDLKRWWQQFDDALLVRLVDAAQQASPTIAAAKARIEDARAARVAGGAALLPAVDAAATAVRGRSDAVSPAGTSLSAGLQAAWEIDVFGGRRAAADAAQARLEGSSARWHDARIAVAAEVASSYLALRACEAQLVQAEADATSRAETSRLTGLAGRPDRVARTRAAARPRQPQRHAAAPGADRRRRHTGRRAGAAPRRACRGARRRRRQRGHGSG
jgi:outer membrane protein, multidrug efflux system